LFNNPSTFPVPSGISAVQTSQNDTSGRFTPSNFATAYDGFRLSGNSTVNSVSWQGGYFNPAMNNPADPISAFTLTFWNNASNNQPGTAILSEIIPGNAHETLLGLEPGAASPTLVFAYNTALPAPFTALANTTYWLSIVPDLNATDPNVGFWGWQTSFGSNPALPFVVTDFMGARLQGNSSGGPEQGQPQHLAFALFGVQQVTPSPTPTVPEPSSLTLSAIGGIALAGWRWRRRGTRRQAV
jgi:hypothetical protein